VNIGADLTANGRLSFGVMLNYLYEPDQLELNHEHYVESGRLAIAPSLAAMAKRIDAAWALDEGLRHPSLSNAGPQPAKA
jgi:hypothetical protein